MLGRTPEEVAKFLAKTTGLNKTMIGEYLGEREETCLRVMHSYVDAMDFAGSEFDTAIRYIFLTLLIARNATLKRSCSTIISSRGGLK